MRRASRFPVVVNDNDNGELLESRQTDKDTSHIASPQTVIDKPTVADCISCRIAISDS